MGAKDSRVYLFDNLKAVLITLVVFGHMLEQLLGPGEEGSTVAIYAFIYLFHMPLFAFCSGYMAKYNPRKILTRLVVPYFLLQLLYILLERFVLGNDEIVLQFTTPYWMLWYLMALAGWTLLLPLLEVMTENRRNMFLIICLALVLGVAVGFENTVGRYMSLSRMIYFFPFFAIGFCIKKAGREETFRLVISKWYGRGFAGVLSVFIGVWLAYNYADINVVWLYGGDPFLRLGSNYVIRSVIYIATFVTGFFLLTILPQRWCFFSYIGQRTMSVFLLHGFVDRLMGKYQVIDYFPEGVLRYLSLFACSMVVVFVFSLRPFSKFRKKAEMERVEGVQVP